MNPLRLNFSEKFQLHKAEQSMLYFLFRPGFEHPKESVAVPVLHCRKNDMIHSDNYHCPEVLHNEESEEKLPVSIRPMQ